MSSILGNLTLLNFSQIDLDNSSLLEVQGGSIILSNNGKLKFNGNSSGIIYTGDVIMNDGSYLSLNEYSLLEIIQGTIILNNVSVIIEQSPNSKIINSKSVNFANGGKFISFDISKNIFIYMYT